MRSGRHLKRRAYGSFIAAVLAVNCLAVSNTPVRAEGLIRIAEQYGISYLPLQVLRVQEGIEKKGKELGLDIKVEWTKLSGGSTVNDAVLSGAIDIGGAGIGPLLTIWDRTHGSANVKGIAALGSLPNFLISRNPNVKKLEDLTKADKIAVPTVAVSVQGRTLQIAAEKAFGSGQHARLDELTVSLPHPDATAALIAGGSEINAHVSVPPYQYQVLKEQPAAHKVFSSYDVLGGPASQVSVFATEKWRADNPKTYAVFVAALKEAEAWIQANKDAAAEVYIRAEN
ncbi:MAG: ABC transporter substrate-binding protein [Hyphomicrobium sp.]